MRGGGEEKKTVGGRGNVNKREGEGNRTREVEKERDK